MNQKEKQELFSFYIVATIFLLILTRIGYYIPVLSSKVLLNQDLNFLDLLTGRDYKSFSLFSIGIMPYISAEIIYMLVLVLIRTPKDLRKERISKKTIYINLCICLVLYTASFFKKSVINIAILQVVCFIIYVLVSMLRKKHYEIMQKILKKERTKTVIFIFFVLLQIIQLMYIWNKKGIIEVQLGTAMIHISLYLVGVITLYLLYKYYRSGKRQELDPEEEDLTPYIYMLVLTIVLYITRGIYKRGILNKDTVYIYCILPTLLFLGAVSLSLIAKAVSKINLISGTSGIIMINIIWKLPMMQQISNKNLILPVLFIGEAVFLIIVYKFFSVYKLQVRNPVRRMNADTKGKRIPPTRFIPIQINQLGVSPVIYGTAILSKVPLIITGLVGPISIGVWHDIGSMVLFSFTVFIMSYLIYNIMYEGKAKQIVKEIEANNEMFVAKTIKKNDRESFVSQKIFMVNTVWATILCVLILLPQIIIKFIYVGTAELVILSAFGGTSIVILVGTLIELPGRIIRKKKEVYGNQ